LLKLAGCVLMIKLATMTGVKEYTDGDQVEIWLNDIGRVVIRAYNEGGNNYTEVDLVHVLEWGSLRASKSGDFVDYDAIRIAPLSTSK
jgi:hypothetical protein